jgi:hypothetical protein
MKKQKYIYTLIVLFALIYSCKKNNEEEINCSGVSPSYNTEIKPIINSNCLSSGCHNAGSVNGDFTTYDGLKTVASSGALEKRVVIDKTMPATGPLSLADRKKIKCWISSGAANN